MRLLKRRRIKRQHKLCIETKNKQKIKNKNNKKTKKNTKTTKCQPWHLLRYGRIEKIMQLNIGRKESYVAKTQSAVNRYKEKVVKKLQSPHACSLTYENKKKHLKKENKKQKTPPAR